jgi:hypothetical protein
LISEKRKEYSRNYQRNWIKQRRLDWLAIHGACVKCGSRESLQVDHVDRTKKISHRIWSWKKERREKELAKCQVLCTKCHVIKTQDELSRGKSYREHGTLRMYEGGKCRCELCVCFYRNYRYIQIKMLRKKWNGRRAPSTVLQ